MDIFGDGDRKETEARGRVIQAGRRKDTGLNGGPLEGTGGFQPTTSRNEGIRASKAGSLWQCGNNNWVDLSLNATETFGKVW
jgi:hypothetical protein